MPAMFAQPPSHVDHRSAYCAAPELRFRYHLERRVVEPVAALGTLLARRSARRFVELVPRPGHGRVHCGLLHRRLALVRSESSRGLSAPPQRLDSTRGARDVTKRTKSASALEAKRRLSKSLARTCELVSPPSTVRYSCAASRGRSRKTSLRKRLARPAHASDLDPGHGGRDAPARAAQWLHAGFDVMQRNGLRLPALITSFLACESMPQCRSRVPARHPLVVTPLRPRFVSAASQRGPRSRTRERKVRCDRLTWIEAALRTWAPTLCGSPAPRSGSRLSSSKERRSGGGRRRWASPKAISQGVRSLRARQDEQDRKGGTVLASHRARSSSLLARGHRASRGARPPLRFLLRARACSGRTNATNAPSAPSEPLLMAPRPVAPHTLAGRAARRTSCPLRRGARDGLGRRATLRPFAGGDDDDLRASSPAVSPSTTVCSVARNVEEGLALSTLPPGCSRKRACAR